MVNANQLKTLQDQLTAFTTRIETRLEDLQTSTDEAKTELSTKIDGISNRLDGYDAKLIEIEKNVQSTDDRLEDLSAQIANKDDNIRKKFEELSKKIEDLEGKVAMYENVPNELGELAEKVEDRTNRQLRETLVFKGIPEDEDTEEDKYTETKKLLATVISTHVTGVSYDEALLQIKRAHREADRDDHYRAGKRHIFAAFHSWDLCQLILQTFGRKCIDDHDFPIAAEQKYGPLTSKRRQLALRARKELKKAGTIVSGYVDFPAKLFVNYPGEVIENKKVYRLHTNFSKHKVWTLIRT